eukprot:13484175-Alexandrium_andersonii.AAC.1
MCTSPSCNRLLLEVVRVLNKPCSVALARPLARSCLRSMDRLSDEGPMGPPAPEKPPRFLR